MRPNRLDITHTLSLFVHTTLTGPFEQRMHRVRAAHGLDNPVKEIAFKSLKYGPVARALPDYLAALNDRVLGLLTTITIDKRIGSLFASKRSELSAVLSREGLGTWKPRVAEKLLRVMHTVCYLAALLGHDGQDIFWMSDSDAIFAPSPDATGRVFGRVLDLYAEDRFGQRGYASAFKPLALPFADLLSAVDLAAGATEQYFTNSQMMDDVRVSPGTDVILSWLAMDGIALRKEALLLQPDPQGIRVGGLRFELKHRPAGSVVIPIFT